VRRAFLSVATPGPEPRISFSTSFERSLRHLCSNTDGFHIEYGSSNRQHVFEQVTLANAYGGLPPHLAATYGVTLMSMIEMGCTTLQIA
jgi:hypothetical protein